MDLFLHIKITYLPKHNLHKVKEDLWMKCIEENVLPTKDEFEQKAKAAIDALPPLAPQSTEKVVCYNDVQGLIADKETLYVMVANQEATWPVLTIKGWSTLHANSERACYWADILRELKLKEYEEVDIEAAIKSACTH